MPKAITTMLEARDSAIYHAAQEVGAITKMLREQADDSDEFSYQPPRTGKIRIERWKRTKAGISVYAPMAVKWIQHRTTRRWRGVVVSTFKVSRSAKTAREFSDHKYRVQEYLAAVQELLQLRSQAFTRLETFRRSVMLADRAQSPRLRAIALKLQEDLAAVPAELRALQRTEPQWLEDE